MDRLEGMLERVLEGLTTKTKNNKRKRGKKKTEKKSKQKNKKKKNGSEKKRARTDAVSITVKNPSTGQQIRVGDMSNKGNRTMWDMARSARLEDNNSGPHSKNLIRILKKAIEKGYPIDKIPPDIILQRIRDAAISKVGPGILVGNDVKAGGVSTLDEGTSATGRKVERTTASFLGLVQTVNLDMSDMPVGDGGFHEHLASIKSDVMDIIKEEMTKRSKFKIYLNYTAMLSRDETLGKGEMTWIPEKGNGGSVVIEEDVGEEKDKEKEPEEDNEPTRKINRVYPPEAREHSFSSMDSLGAIPIKINTEVEGEIQDMMEAIEAAIEAFQEKGSGYVFLGSVRMEIHIMAMNASNPQSLRKGDDIPRAGFYLQLPPWLNTNKKKGLIFNPQPQKAHSKDEQDGICFALCLLDVLYPTERNRYNRGGVEHLMLPFRNGEINLPKDQDYPLSLKERDLEKTELSVGKFSFDIYLIGQEKDDICNIYESRLQGKDERLHVDLGVLVGEHPRNAGESTAHFVRIRNLAGLLRKGSSNTGLVHCKRCLTAHRPENMEAHQRDCYQTGDAIRAILPTEGGKDHYVKFTRFRQTNRAPFVIYADFEAFLLSAEEGEGKKKEAEGDGRKRKVASVHDPSCWSYSISCARQQHASISSRGRPPLSEVRSYCGEKSMATFFENMTEDVEVIREIVAKNRKSRTSAQRSCKIDPSRDGYEGWRAGTMCTVCKRSLASNPDPWLGGLAAPCDDPVIAMEDYTLITVGYRHASCDKEFHKADKRLLIPVYFHNFKGYDCYHVLRGLRDNQSTANCKLECIAKSIEKFTSLTLNDDIRFVDSMSFLNGALDRMVDNLKKGAKREDLYLRFKPVWDHFERLYGTEWVKDMFEPILLSKGIYPYEYIDSPEVMKEAFIPSRNAFISHLKGGKGISKNQYRQAKVAFKAMKCENLADYTVRYCELDVLLLQCCFERFRETCIVPSSYGLDPAHFLTAPSLAWAACLFKGRMTKTPLRVENVTDPEIFFMTERGIRGGMCQVMHNYATSNFPGMPEGLVPGQKYDPERGEERLFYMDANSLYAWAMRQPIPISHYKMDYRRQEGEYMDLPWLCMNMEEVKAAVMELDPEGDIGYIMEVDLVYPENLHNSHNDYPLAPDSKIPRPSEHTKSVMRQMGKTPSVTGRSLPKKLVQDFENKNKYVIHYRNLQLYLSLGMELTCIHRVVSFKQTPWLRDYIDFNIRMRAEAGDEIAKEFYKLMNNAVFGKTMEDVRKRRSIDFYFENDYERALHHVSSPFAKQFKIVKEDSMMVLEKRRHRVTLNRPVIVGMTILDLSKWHMYDFRYNKLASEFPYPESKVLYLDTDSLFLSLSSLNGEPVLQKLANLHNRLGCLDISATHQQYPEHELFSLYGANPKIGAKVPGNMKDENFGRPMLEAVFLCSKMYSMVVAKPKPKKAALNGGIVKRTEHGKRKGIPKSVEGITHNNYLRVGRENTRETVTFQTIEHDRRTYSIYTEEKTKVALSSVDDKSFYYGFNNSLRHGHYKIFEQ